MNRFSITFTLLALVVMSGCSCANAASRVKENYNVSEKLSIQLVPNISEYSINEVSEGAIRFSALVQNKDSNSVIFAHPVICFPAHYQVGRTLHFKERHGKSEIILTIETPGGRTVILRDGPHFFDPDNISHFTINPEKSKLFHVGWFFQNTRGRWEDAPKAASAFMEKGLYRVQLLYRNFFPKALVHDEITGRSRLIEVWTGEIESNAVIVKIE